MMICFCFIFVDKPHLTASGIKMATLGDTVTLECQVEAHPDPKMMFWKDFAQRVPIIPGSKYEINFTRNKEVRIICHFVILKHVNISIKLKARRGSTMASRLGGRLFWLDQNVTV